jgi:hypothetical protein
MEYSIAEVIERIGPDWARLVPAAARQFKQDSDEAAFAAAERTRQAKLAAHFAPQADGEVLDFSATLLTSGFDFQSESYRGGTPARCPG